MFLLKAQDVVPKSLDGTEMFPIKRETFPKTGLEAPLWEPFSAPAGPRCPA